MTHWIEINNCYYPYPFDTNWKYYYEIIKKEDKEKMISHKSEDCEEDNDFINPLLKKIEELRK